MFYEEAIDEGVTVRYEVANILYNSRHAPHDVTIITNSTFGGMLFLDGELQLATGDEHIYHEALVHPAMTSVGRRARVLILGGGDGCTLREVLRYPDVLHVDLVDYDDALVDLFSTRFRAWNGSALLHRAVHYHHSCALRWVAEASTDAARRGHYDVIFVDLTDSFFLDQDFVRGVVSLLAPGGCYVFQAGPTLPGALLEQLAQLNPGVAYQAFVPSFMRQWNFVTNRPREAPLTVPFPHTVRSLQPHRIANLYV